MKYCVFSHRECGMLQKVHLRKWKMMRLQCGNCKILLLSAKLEEEMVELPFAVFSTSLSVWQTGGCECVFVLTQAGWSSSSTLLRPPEHQTKVMLMENWPLTPSISAIGSHIMTHEAKTGKNCVTWRSDTVQPLAVTWSHGFWLQPMRFRCLDWQRKSSPISNKVPPSLNQTTASSCFGNHPLPSAASWM